MDPPWVRENIGLGIAGRDDNVPLSTFFLQIIKKQTSTIALPLCQIASILYRLSLDLWEEKSRNYISPLSEVPRSPPLRGPQVRYERWKSLSSHGDCRLMGVSRQQKGGFKSRFVLLLTHLVSSFPCNFHTSHFLKAVILGLVPLSSYGCRILQFLRLNWFPPRHLIEFCFPSLTPSQQRRVVDLVCRSLTITGPHFLVGRVFSFPFLDSDLENVS